MKRGFLTARRPASTLQQTSMLANDSSSTRRQTPVCQLSMYVRSRILATSYPNSKTSASKRATQTQSAASTSCRQTHFGDPHGMVAAWMLRNRTSYKRSGAMRLSRQVRQPHTGHKLWFRVRFGRSSLSIRLTGSWWHIENHHEHPTTSSAR